MLMFKSENAEYRKSVLEMDNLQFLNQLDDRGGYDEMQDIITYLTSKLLMTPYKLDSMLWFAYGWGLVVLNSEIAPFQWKQTEYGPSSLDVPKLYPIEKFGMVPQAPEPEIDFEVKALLDAIITRYGKLSAEDLGERISYHLKGMVEPGSPIEARDAYLFFTSAIFEDKLVDF